MRIAIYHNLPSGGGKRALWEMVRRLAQEHELDVYTLSCAEHDFCDLRPLCRRHIVFPFTSMPLMQRPFGRLNQGIRALDLYRLRTLQRQVARQIDAAGYDVVFVHNCQYGQSPSLLSFLSTPSVYYCQEPPRSIYEPTLPRPYNNLKGGQKMGNWLDPLPYVYRKTLNSLDRGNVSRADLVLVNSAYSQESLYRIYGLFARTCYLGVDLQRFRPLPLPKTNIVLSVGALRAGKGFDFLLSSLATIEATRRPTLVVVSNFVDVRELAYLEGLAGELGVRFEVRSRVSDEELVDLYNQALLTLYAPVMEPFGLVPIESMACGTPVVGVREGGVRETVVDDETGILTERDPRLFAAAVERLLGDSARREQFGRQGKLVVERQWRWERTVLELEEHFARAAQSRG